MHIDRLDHLVLTVANIERTVRFYVRVLGMEDVTFGEGRRALHFGRQKINLHQHGAEFEPKAHAPTPGSADLCFITGTPLGRVIDELRAKHVTIELGPIERMGSGGRLNSIYLRDPDRNLIELSNYESA